MVNTKSTRVIKSQKALPRVQSETFVRIHARLYGWHPVTEYVVHTHDGH